LTPELRQACLDGNMALLPCAFVDIAAEDEQEDDDEGNFALVGNNCSATPPQNIDASAFQFLNDVISSGGALPDPALLATTFAYVPILPPVVATTAAGAVALGLPFALPQPPCVSGSTLAACN
jgi:hypothetical protein